MKTKNILLLILAFSLSILSCTGNEDTKDEVLSISGVTVNIGQNEMTIGDTITIKATVQPYNLAPDRIEWDESMRDVVFWRTTNPDVATVSQDGLVKAVGKGTCNIMFVCGPYAAQCSVIVRHFDIDDIMGQWKSGDGQDCLFSFGGTGTVDQDSVSWTFDGMRLILNRSVNADTLIITSVDPGRFTYYNRSNPQKSPVQMRLVARPITENDLSHGIIQVAGSNGQYYDAVDLGLPDGTLWSTCNLNALSPEQEGAFYAWGETVPKNSFVIENYEWYDNSSLSLTKYTQGQPQTLDAADDAASIARGGQWRTPTAREIMELYDNCSCIWANINNTDGIMFSSKVKGFENNSIFLPFAGIKDSFYQSMVNDNRKVGVYWSSTLNGDDDLSAGYLQLFLIPYDKTDSFYKEIHPNATAKRYTGACIRPVVSK